MEQEKPTEEKEPEKQEEVKTQEAEQETEKQEKSAEPEKAEEVKSEETNQLTEKGEQNTIKQEKEQAKKSEQKPKVPFYERWHKLFVVVPLLIFILSLAFLGFKWLNGEELIKKDVSLTGGITLTVQYDKEISLTDLEKEFSDFPDVTVRKLSEVGTGKQIGLIIETSSGDINSFKEKIENSLQIKLTDENSSLEFTGPLLSKSFFRQLTKAFIFAFIFIAIVVFFIFRVFVPSFIAVFSILSDALITLTILSVFDFRLSSAGIAAFLMLIGYSIDTDILLTTRVLKRKEKEFYTRLKEAAQTGLTMTFAGIIAVLISYFLLISPVLKEIFLILTIGLFVDIMNTWLLNASVLKIYIDRKK